MEFHFSFSLNFHLLCIIKNWNGIRNCGQMLKLDGNSNKNPLFCTYKMLDVLGNLLMEQSEKCTEIGIPTGLWCCSWKANSKTTFTVSTLHNHIRLWNVSMTPTPQYPYLIAKKKSNSLSAANNPSDRLL